MSEWKTYKLGEIAELRKEQIIPNGIEQPYIGLEHIEQQSLRLNGVGSSNSVISNKFKFYSGDILYGKLRPYFRKVYQPKFEGVCSTDIYVIKNKKPVEQDFLYYLIATEEFTNIANSGSSGTRMPRADWKQLQNSEWQIPDLPTQRQIAQILSSLDDKIELNLQMNQTLEAMAQAIFKEWFVNFNYPKSLNYDSFDLSDLHDVKNQGNQENLKNQGSDNGLPKGWRRGSVLEIASLLSGGTPKTSEPDFWDGEINWISAKDITSSNNQFIIETEKTLTELGIKKSAAKLLPPFTTIISARGTVGNFCILPKEMAISQSNYGLKSKRNYDFFLFLLVKNMLSMMKAFAYGAVFDTITTKTFEAMEITIPKNQVIEEFENYIKPIYSKILTNQMQIQSLTQLRDTLLPKLMSGSLNLDSFYFSDESDSVGKSTKSFNHKNQSADK